MKPLQRLLSKKVSLYDSGYKVPAPIKIGNKPKVSFNDLPQHEQQRRAMEGIYKNKNFNDFGKGVGP